MQTTFTFKDEDGETIRLVAHGDGEPVVVMNDDLTAILTSKAALELSSALISAVNEPVRIAADAAEKEADEKRRAVIADNEVAFREAGYFAPSHWANKLADAGYGVFKV